MHSAKTKTHTVDLLSPFTWDADKLAALAEILGEPCRIPLKGCDSWALMINGSRVHTPSYSWLKLRANKSASTSEKSARHIKFWVEFLLNKPDSRWDDDECFSDVMVATEWDLYECKQHCLEELEWSPSQWNSFLSNVKQFHEYIKERFKVPRPFTLQEVPGRDGQIVTTTGLSVRDNASSSGTPLTPDYADLLLRGASRTDSSGVGHDGPSSPRDVAFINHALAGGQRRESLALMTIYEVPPPPTNGSPFVMARVPDASAKNLKGSISRAFEFRMQRVRNYINAPTFGRGDLVAASIRNHQKGIKGEPLRVHSANASTWTEVDADGVVGQKRAWNDTTADQRRRLVDADGSSPLIHLTMKGKPMSVHTASAIVERARKFVIDNLDDLFPPDFTLHDCRHTFAVHFAICHYLGELQRWDSNYRQANLQNALWMTQVALGHTDPASTSMYTSHAQDQMAADPPIPVDRYVGRRTY